MIITVEIFRISSQTRKLTVFKDKIEAVFEHYIKKQLARNSFEISIKGVKLIHLKFIKDIKLFAKDLTKLHTMQQAGLSTNINKNISNKGHAKFMAERRWQRSNGVGHLKKLFTMKFSQYWK